MIMMRPVDYTWKAELYDQKLGYVSHFGKEVVALLRPAHGERILDLGCGTGDLAFEISKAGATVTGIDYSGEMIQQARTKYPSIYFEVGDGQRFAFDAEFDAVFSNAALHWMKNAEQVLACVWNALKSGGRFVAEFGGRGNVDTIIQSMLETLLEDYQLDGTSLNPWFFPSIAEYSALLERQGFRVVYAAHFDRPTVLEDGENGLVHWLSGFAGPFLSSLREETRQEAYAKIAHKARERLYQDGSWVADYKRIRIMAIKPEIPPYNNNTTRTL